MKRTRAIRFLLLLMINYTLAVKRAPALLMRICQIVNLLQMLRAEV